MDGKFALAVDGDLLIKFKLAPKQFIEEKVLESLHFETQLSDLMEKVYRLFSFRARSENEIREYFKILNYKLRKKREDQINPTTVDLLIVRLKEKGMVDDLIFAQSWVESRRRSKAKGLWALKSELSQKGISKDVIEKALDKSSGEDEEALAGQALGKKLKGWKSLGIIEFRKKAIGYLQRQGFAYSVAKKVAFNAKKS